MSSQDNGNSDAGNSRLLTLLNSVRSRETIEGLSTETLEHTEHSQNKFAKFWIFVMIVLFLLVGFAGTRFWPSLLAMRILEYLFTTSLHIYALFALFRSMIPGEFEKPIQYSVLIAVPVASAINVGVRLFSVSGWMGYKLSIPTYFGHVSLTATHDWLHGISSYTPLHLGFFISLAVLLLILWLHSKVRFANFIAPFIFYFFTSLFLVYATNQILAILSRYTSNALKW